MKEGHERGRPVLTSIVDELRAAAGPRHFEAVMAAFTDGASLLEDDRPADALPRALEVKRWAPRSRRGRELLGLVLYQLGRYREAVAEEQRLLDEFKHESAADEARVREPRIGGLQS